MNRIPFFILFIFLGLESLSQNLVPNPSFEEYWQCPVFTGDFGNLVIDWFDPVQDSPEYFNECATQYVGVPANVPGFQYAQDGTGYSGFFWTSTSGDGPKSKEYIATELIIELQKGREYCLSYYVSLCDSCQYGMDRLGAFFYDDENLGGNFSEHSPPAIAQVESPEGQFYVDKINWEKVEGRFCAKGGERFLAIGNFNRNSETNLLQTQDWNNSFIGVGYYYVDMVSLYPCGFCEDFLPEVPNVFTPNNDGVNDEIQLVGGAEMELVIFNRWGEIVYKRLGTVIQWKGTNDSGIRLSDGVYYYILQGNSSKKSGTITLFH